MKTITITDLRRHWPLVEASLQMEKEILVTRNGHPVAKLVRITEREARRLRCNLEQLRA